MQQAQLPVALVFGGVYFLAVYAISRVYTFFPFLLAGLGVMSTVTLILYGRDKRAARRQQQRTPENTLHLMALLGGWPGALIARPLFRHKTRKHPFSAILWATIACNLLGLAGFFFADPLEPTRAWLDAVALHWRPALNH